MTPLLGTDARLVWRGGFLSVYAILVVVYVVVLRLLPDTLAKPLLPALLFADPSVLGLLIGGVMVLLERQEGVLLALGVTPVRSDHWLAAKVLVLTSLSVTVATAVAVGAHGLAAPGLLALGVAGISVFCVLLAICVAARASTFNRFLMLVQGVGLPLSLPFGEVLFGWQGAWLRLLPTGAGLDLIFAGTGRPITPVRIGTDLAIMALWSALAWVWARRTVQAHLFVKPQGGVW